MLVRTAAANERCHDGIHGHGYGGGGHEPQGLYGQAAAPAKPVSVAAGGGFAAPTPNTAAAVAGYAPAAGGDVDVFPRHSSTASSAVTAAAPKSPVPAGRVDLLVQCEEHRGAQLRQPQARRRWRLGLPVRPAQHRRVLQQLRHEAPVRRLMRDVRRCPVPPLAWAEAPQAAERPEGCSLADARRQGVGRTRAAKRDAQT